MIAESASMTFLSYPMAEVKGLQRRALGGEEAARPFFVGLFDAATPCWTCGNEITEQGRVAIFPDPRRPSWAILGAECVECCKRDDRRARELAVMQAMWPRTKFERRKDLVPGYLRGSRPKPQRRHG